MKALLFVLIWVGAALLVMGTAFFLTRSTGEKPGFRGNLSGGIRGLIALAALFIVVGIPAYVLTQTSDRLPSGAGTYTLAASPSERDGRLIFRQTCSSCHTLSAANARGVYGPNLDVRLGGKTADPKATAARVETAITAGPSVMPKGLLDGRDKKLVAEYVASVVGR
ncbi:MAG: c-type cytochrome [Solirubrobacterales bacterium]